MNLVITISHKVHGDSGNNNLMVKFTVNLVITTSHKAHSEPGNNDLTQSSQWTWLWSSGLAERRGTSRCSWCSIDCCTCWRRRNGLAETAGSRARGRRTGVETSCPESPVPHQCSESPALCRTGLCSILLCRPLGRTQHPCWHVMLC